jgi:general stress protein YciG
MDPERQREIARKGGATVSQNREHMAEIGRKGGEASGNSRSNKVNQQNNQETIQQNND